MASAGPYASLHLAPDIILWHAQTCPQSIFSTLLLQQRMPTSRRCLCGSPGLHCSLLSTNWPTGGSTGQGAVKRVCVCVCFFTVCVLLLIAISYNWRCMKLNSTYSLTYLISYSTCISSASQETAFAHDHQHSIHLLAAILPNVHRF